MPDYYELAYLQSQLFTGWSPAMKLERDMYKYVRTVRPRRNPQAAFDVTSSDISNPGRMDTWIK